MCSHIRERRIQGLVVEYRREGMLVRVSVDRGKRTFLVVTPLATRQAFEFDKTLLCLSSIGDLRIETIYILFIEYYKNWAYKRVSSLPLVCLRIYGEINPVFVFDEDNFLGHFPDWQAGLVNTFPEIMNYYIGYFHYYQ